MNIDIELFNTPIQILNKITQIDAKPEMSDLEYAFICGLIKRIKPHKILEFGVSTGTTSSILMNCVDTLNLNEECQIFSVGTDKVFSYAINCHTGFLANEAKQFLERPIQYKLLLNKSVSDIVDVIGNDIDFVILNNINSFPQIFFDYLTIYPFLKKNACVVLSSLDSFLIDNGEYHFASQLLFNTIVADKIKPKDSKNSLEISNIGALFLSNDSEKYISDCFSALSLTWQAIPNTDELTRTKNILRQYYNDDLLSIFDSAVKQNTANDKIHLTIQSQNNSNRISISYKIGLAITLIPRKIYQAIPRKKDKEITWQERRCIIRKQARKEARKYHLPRKSYIYSVTGLKAKFYLPNYKDDLIQQSIIYYKTYFENENLQFITQKWCRGIIGKLIKNSTVLDIGSNIGNHALYFLLECEAKMVHCFEPIESTFKILEKNIKINHVEDRACLYNVAVGEKTGSAAIEHYEEENIGGTVLTDEENGSIKVVTIDELNIAGDICLVKIDVEGFEKKVIAGMVQTLKKHHPFIMIEIQKNIFSEITNQLTSLGYCYIHLGDIDYLFFSCPLN